MLTDDRRERADARFRTLLTTWLNSLPPGGWEGTSHQLGDELAAFGERHRLVAFVPTCPARKVTGLAKFLAENGCAVTVRRTRRRRTIRFTRGALRAPA